MNTPIVTVGGRPGCIFEGQVPETFCFVPQDFIAVEGSDVQVAEGEYVRSGWDVRNMRFNQSSSGEHLFPDVRRPVGDLESESVRMFLQRISLVRVT